MEPKFQSFEQWYRAQISLWERCGIFVDKDYQSEYANQFHIELHSGNGLGRISLYESNDFYWVDFEAGNVNVEDWFFRINIDYDSPDDIRAANEEFIQYMKL